MEFLMEKTEKFICASEDYAEKLVESYKDAEETLIDYKISYKETKDMDYYIVTIKVRYLTLAEAKEKVNA